MKTGKEKWELLSRMLRSARTVRVLLGGCYELDKLAGFHFYETVLDKAILLWEVFPV